MPGWAPAAGRLPRPVGQGADRCVAFTAWFPSVPAWYWRFPCGITDLVTPPQVVVQVRQSRDAITFSPDHARVGQRIRFLVEGADNFNHEFTAKGTPIQGLNVRKGTAAGSIEKGKVKSVDWTPDKPGVYEFCCDQPTHTEKGSFTVEG